MFITEKERGRGILMKFLILEFLRKMQKNVFISETEQASVILTEFLIHRVSAESTGKFLQNLFQATFGTILNF